MLFLVSSFWVQISCWWWVKELPKVGVEIPHQLQSWCGALHTKWIQSYAHDHINISEVFYLLFHILLKCCRNLPTKIKFWHLDGHNIKSTYRWFGHVPEEARSTPFFLFAMACWLMNKIRIIWKMWKTHLSWEQSPNNMHKNDIIPAFSKNLPLQTQGYQLSKISKQMRHYTETFNQLIKLLQKKVSEL